MGFSNKVIKKLISIKTFGNSMEPLFVDGDILYIRKVLFQAISINDIIVIKKYNKLVTHRVIYKTSKYVVTKGDHNSISDGKIYPRNVIGKIYAIKRSGKMFHPEDSYLLQSTVYLQIIVNIKNILKANNIDFVFLKGLPLHLLFTGMHPRRIYADCDILINQNDREKVDKIMKEMGFMTNESVSKKYFRPFLGNDIKEKQYLKLIHGIPVNIDIHFVIPISTHAVKLPFMLFDQYENQISHDFLIQKKEIKIYDEVFPVLNDDFLVLYLLFHFYEHKWTEIHRLEFIYQVVSRTKINWDFIYSYAKTKKILNFIIPGIYLLNKYYRVDRPYRLLRKSYPESIKYALSIYKSFINERVLFDNLASPFDRIKKALLLFLLFDESGIKKFAYMLHPRLVVHLVYFVAAIIKFKYETKNKTHDYRQKHRRWDRHFFAQHATFE